MMETKNESFEKKLERTDSALELANKSLELGNTLLESFNLLVTTDDNAHHNTLLNALDSTEEEIFSPNKNARLIKKRKVVREMVDTEKRYVDGLYLLLNHFYKGLQSSMLLSNDLIKLIFPSCLDHIHLLHSELHARLSERIVMWSQSSTITDLLHLYFVSNGDYIFSLYQQFLSSFSSSVSSLRAVCDKNKLVRGHLDALESAEACRRLKVTSYMTTPVQRMPRYILLLKELMKVTERGSKELESLEECVVSLGRYLSALNEGIECSIGAACNDGNVVTTFAGGVKSGDDKAQVAKAAGRHGGSKEAPVGNAGIKNRSSFKIGWKKKSDEECFSSKKPCRTWSFQREKSKVLRSPRSMNCTEKKENRMRSSEGALNGEKVVGGGFNGEKVVSGSLGEEKSYLRDFSKVKLRGGTNFLNASCVSTLKKASLLKRKLTSLSDMGSSLRHKYKKPLKAHQLDSKHFKSSNQSLLENGGENGEALSKKDEEKNRLLLQKVEKEEEDDDEVFNEIGSERVGSNNVVNDRHALKKGSVDKSDKRRKLAGSIYSNKVIKAPLKT